MARKIKDILLKRGYSEEEIANNPLFSDPRFVSAIEAEAAEADEHASERQRLSDQLTQDQTWYQNTALPQLNRALKDVVSAREEKAALEARLQAMQDYGLRQIAGEGGGDGNAGDKGGAVGDKGSIPPNGFDPSRYVTSDVLEQTASRYGDAITMVQDISDDYRTLFGGSIPGGTTKLRNDYRMACEKEHYTGTLRDYAEKRFNFQAKRDEISAAERKAAEDKIRADERNKVLSEMGNPMTTPMRASRNPFTSRAQGATGLGNGSAGASGSQPWEKTEHERSASRVSKFAAKVAQSA